MSYNRNSRALRAAWATWLPAILLAGGALVAGLLPAGPACAAWPERPLKMVIPFPPGGPTDAVGRQLAQRLSEALGQNVVVENKAGANSAIGSDSVAKAPADGYTLLFNASIFATNPHLLKLPYDIQRDFTPIGLVAKAPLAIVVAANSPFKYLNELIEYARINPGRLNFGIGSNGSAGHLAQEQLKRSAGVEIQMVAYKGSTPAYTDLIGGQIQGFTDPVLGVLPLLPGGRLRLLAVTSKKRLLALPDVPTVAESGLAEFEFFSWYGLWGPPNLPRELTQRLNAELNRWLTSPATREQFERLGYEAQPGTPGEFARFVREDSALAARIIKDGNIRAE